MELTTVPLGEEHDRKAFYSGAPSLNQYRRRYARRILRWLVNRVLAAAPGRPRQVPAFDGVIVHALNDWAAGFYRQFGFVPLSGHPLGLSLPMSRISAAAVDTASPRRAQA